MKSANITLLYMQPPLNKTHGFALVEDYAQSFREGDTFQLANYSHIYVTLTNYRCSFNEQVIHSTIVKYSVTYKNMLTELVDNVSPYTPW